MALFLFGNYNSVEIRPNIIWLVAEDQSVNFFPKYGDETIDLPNLSSLKKWNFFKKNESPVPFCPRQKLHYYGMYPTYWVLIKRIYANFSSAKTK
ncbi:MAG: hypothetical protein CM15mP102_04720 [Flavobacteriales bacterium]|nr:MAG: hypothetical protein CM15mP102_04720 [Flavobacteriales bacterium]